MSEFPICVHEGCGEGANLVTKRCLRHTNEERWADKTKERDALAAQVKVLLAERDQALAKLTEIANGLHGLFATAREEFGAKNYVEHQLVTGEGVKFTVTIQSHDGKAPSELTSEALAETARLRKALQAIASEKGPAAALADAVLKGPAAPAPLAQIVFPDGGAERMALELGVRNQDLERELAALKKELAKRKEPTS